MSRNNPEQHETAKHQITGELAYVEVSNHLCQSKKNITTIHQYHNNTTHSSEVGEIAGDNQDYSYYMMGHHLYVILPSSLSIENQNLVHVESGLSEIIEFNWSSKRDVGILKPKITWVKYTSRKIDMDINAE